MELAVPNTMIELPFTFFLPDFLPSSFIYAGEDMSLL